MTTKVPWNHRNNHINEMLITLNSEDQDPRITALIDNRLFKAFWQGVKHFGRKDLVVFFDQTDADDPVTIVPRETIANSQSLPAAFKDKLNKPARDAAVHLNDSETAFWLVVNLAQGDGVCLAINAKPITPGGAA